MEEADIDICRVCRCEAGEQELFYPCICTGSIKYIHQDCLTQWMRYVSNFLVHVQLHCLERKKKT